MSRYLSEPEAWREIARRVAEGEWEGRGLCAEVWRLEAGCLIAFPTKTKMLGRVMDHVYDLSDRYHGGWYAYPRGRNINARVLAALWLALEAEAEAEAHSLPAGTPRGSV